MKHITSISVVCPVFNEAQYIENILHFFVQNKFDNKELIVIDGGSADATVKIIEKWALQYPSITLLHNAKKYVPQALNLALKKTTGDIIIRLDAHTIYANDYIDKIIETFNITDADIVGGPMNPIGNTTIQKAIAFATCSSFGVGNSKFHDINYSGYVDSVYLGAWRKELFEDVGYFDEQMKRNQDDEFHYRAKSNGKKIYLSAAIKSSYYPRDSFSKLFKQYFQYGLYKPLVIKKVQSELKLRHLVPLAFVLYIVSLPLCFFSFVFIAPLILYLFIDFIICFKVKNAIKIKMAMLLVFPILHISYGTGFLLGLFKIKK
jgi:glycosyltransferase involved in cell wall biosynthesis